MENIFDIIEKIRIIPIIKINNAESAVPLANALKEAGLRCAEITFRSSAAKDAIKLIKSNVPDFIVGAGTILTRDQIDSAMLSGADFFVSPGLDLNILEYCEAKNIPFLPGVVTPSEIQKALNHNIEILKFFPAEASGGVKTIDALYGPFPTVKFIPSGGINMVNISDYLSRPNIIACGGSWFVESDLINAGDFNEIRKNTCMVLRKIKTITEKIN